MSELKRIVDLNNLWGNGKAQTEEELYAQLCLIEEEWKELLEAVGSNDKKETVDALADMIVVVTGMIHRLGYDPDKVMDIVNISNESKMIDPEDWESVQKTLDKYRSDSRYSNVHITKDGVVRGVVTETGASKVLKGVYYKEPQWQELDEDLV